MKNKRIIITSPECNRWGGLYQYIFNFIQFQKEDHQIDLLVTNGRGNDFGRLSALTNCIDCSGEPNLLKRASYTAQLINDLNPSILLSNHSSLTHYLLPLLNDNIRTVVVVHSTDPVFLRVAVIFYRYVWRWIAPSTAIANALRKILPENCHYRIVTIPHGVDTSFYKLSDSAEKIKKGIVFVGSFLPHKGVDLLPKIMEKIALQIPSVCLHIAGDGGYKSQFLREIDRIGLTEKICWHGWIEPSKLVEIFEQVDILLHPARIEGFGLSIIEAMASGLAPVVSRIPGVTDEIIVDRETGVLCQIDAVEGFAEAIVSLLSDENYLRSIKKSAHEYALKEFCITRMMQTYHALFEKTDKSPGKKLSRVRWIYKVATQYIMASPFSAGVPARIRRLLTSLPIFRQ